MKMSKWIALAPVALFVAATAFAADAPPAMSAQQQALMDKMMKAATPGPQHELLKKLAGDWNAKVKMRMDPAQPAQESQSTSTATLLMDGRYCQEVASGQMMGAPFSGMGITGYDNVLGKYVSTWIDNMGTGIQFSEGTYDPASRTLTYTSEMEMMPGMKTPVREVLKLTDKDHMMMEWYETHGGQEKKTMEIAYTRAGKK